MEDVWLESFVQQMKPMCPECGGVLRVNGGRCAACGDEVRLGVKIPEAYLAAWLVTVTSALILAGVGLFLTYLAFRRPYILQYGGDVKSGMLVTTCVLGVLMAVESGMLLGLRGRFCKFSKVVQWVVASGHVVLVGATVAGDVYAIQ